MSDWFPRSSGTRIGSGSMHNPHIFIEFAIHDHEPKNFYFSRNFFSPNSESLT